MLATHVPLMQLRPGAHEADVHWLSDTAWHCPVGMKHAAVPTRHGVSSFRHAPDDGGSAQMPPMQSDPG